MCAGGIFQSTGYRGVARIFPRGGRNNFFDIYYKIPKIYSNIAMHPDNVYIIFIVTNVTLQNCIIFQFHCRVSRKLLLCNVYIKRYINEDIYRSKEQEDKLACQIIPTVAPGKISTYNIGILGPLMSQWLELPTLMLLIPVSNPLVN